MPNLIAQALELRASMVAAHRFDQTPTVPIIVFELLVVLAATGLLLLLWKREKHLLLRFAVTALGIFIFEFFTSPMWSNYKLGPWAYVYQDVSWILTLGWATLIFGTVVLVDRCFAHLHELQRFGVYLGVLTVLVLILEAVVVQLGIRSYAPETLAAGLGSLPFGVPVGALYYVPVFMALVLSFCKYWDFLIFDRALVPVKRKSWVRSLAISFLAVFLFELMVEPMVVNARLPRWSYVYRDISILITGGWIIAVWIAINLVDRCFAPLGLLRRFIGYLAIVFVIILPAESWLLLHGYRVYGPSATAGFSGLLLPLSRIPVEVAFGVPFFFALVLSFVKYWEIVLENRETL